MIYIGIDPSIEHTGWGIINEEGVHLSSGVFQFKAKLKDERYSLIYRGLSAEFSSHVDGRAIAFIEKPVYEKSSRGAACAGPVQWKTSGLLKLFGSSVSAICACAECGVRWCFVTANQWKRGIGPDQILARVNVLHPGREWGSFDEVEGLALAHWGRKRLADGKELEIYV